LQSGKRIVHDLARKRFPAGRGKLQLKLLQLPLA
jgi:hypothetical protein